MIRQKLNYSTILNHNKWHNHESLIIKILIFQSKKKSWADMIFGEIYL